MKAPKFTLDNGDMPSETAPEIVYRKHEHRFCIFTGWSKGSPPNKIYACYDVTSKGKTEPTLKIHYYELHGNNRLGYSTAAVIEHWAPGVPSPARMTPADHKMAMEALYRRALPGKLPEITVKKEGTPNETKKSNSKRRSRKRSESTSPQDSSPPPPPKKKQKPGSGTSNANANESADKAIEEFLDPSKMPSKARLKVLANTIFKNHLRKPKAPTKEQMVEMRDFVLFNEPEFKIWQSVAYQEYVASLRKEKGDAEDEDDEDEDDEDEDDEDEDDEETGGASDWRGQSTVRLQELDRRLLNGRHDGEEDRVLVNEILGIFSSEDRDAWAKTKSMLASMF